MSKRPAFTITEVRLIVSALHDAIGWQQGLADAYAHVPKSPERADALVMEKRYRLLLKKITNSPKTPFEIFAEGLTSVSVFDVLKGNK